MYDLVKGYNNYLKPENNYVLDLSTWRMESQTTRNQALQISKQSTTESWNPNKLRT